MTHDSRRSVDRNTDPRYYSVMRLPLMAGKHHYVSQFHLRHFVDPNSLGTPAPWLWLGNLGNRFVRRRAPKNVAWQRGRFDGPGGLADKTQSLELHLATNIESAAACKLADFLDDERGTRANLPPEVARYLAWAATRGLPMDDLIQTWVDECSDHTAQLAEAPPEGWEEIGDHARTHRLEHPQHGIKDNVPSCEVGVLISDGWRLLLSDDDILEFMHVQAWYFQVSLFPRLTWHTIGAPEGSSFVIGDRPVVWGFQDSLKVRPNELRHRDIQLVAPLSRSIALLAHHESALTPSRILPDEINAIMANAARAWIAGSDENTVIEAMATNSSSVA